MLHHPSAPVQLARDKSTHGRGDRDTVGTWGKQPSVVVVPDVMTLGKKLGGCLWKGKSFCNDASLLA